MLPADTTQPVCGSRASDDAVHDCRTGTIPEVPGRAATHRLPDAGTHIRISGCAIAG